MENVANEPIGLVKSSDIYLLITYIKVNIIVLYYYDFLIRRVAFGMAKIKIRETLESSPLPPSKRAPRLSTIHQWAPDDVEEKEETFVENEDEEILKNYNEFLSKVSGKTSVVGCSSVEQRVHRKWEEMKPGIKTECVKKATEACHVVYEVIAPNAGEELFEAIQPAG